MTKSGPMGNANLGNRPLRRRVLLVLSLLAAGLVLLPLSVYVFGQQVVGPYEGSGGIIGFTGSIYAGLLRGEASAWLLGASPALLATCWIGLRRATRRQPQARHGAARAAPDTTQS